MGRPTTSSSPARRTRRGRGARLMLATSAALLLTLLFAAGAEAAKSGKLLYAKRIGSSTTEAGATAIAAGPKGVTALAGYQRQGTYYPMVAKYTSAGKRVWLRRYTAAVEGWADDVAFDRSGNVYVAATVWSGTRPDIVVLKYSAGGVLRWATEPYDSGSNREDEAVKLAVDGKGDVVVLGESNYTGRMGIVVLKYKKKNGKLAWAEPARWDPDPGDPDQGDHDMADLALDGKGDIYVAGSVKFAGIEGGLIRKARGSDGAKLLGWVHEPRTGDSSFFETLTIRGSSVVATGSAWTEGVDHSRNALIVKFDRGLQKKASKEWGVVNKSEEWFREAVIDSKGSVFVTGEQWLEDKYDGVVTMKLNAKLKTVWSTTYMPARKGTAGWYIARDGAGNVYVGCGQNVNAPTGGRYLTIKYSAAGARKWVRTWSPRGGSTWHPVGLVLGSKDGVYVGGNVRSKGDVHQAVLLKYRR